MMQQGIIHRAIHKVEKRNKRHLCIDIPGYLNKQNRTIITEFGAVKIEATERSSINKSINIILFPFCTVTKDITVSIIFVQY